MIIRNPGLYGHFEKWTLILAVGADNWKHVRFRKVAGTTAERFEEFTSSMLAGLQDHPPRVVLFDNLSSHFSDTIQTACDASPHENLTRPTYRPNDVPIDFFPNQIEQGLKSRMYRITNEDEFVEAVHDLVAHLVGVCATFL